MATGSRRIPRYSDLNEFLYVNRKQVNKTALAKQLGVWPSKLTALLNPDQYRVSVDEDLVHRIAEVLHQSADHVRNLYRRAA